MNDKATQSAQTKKTHSKASGGGVPAGWREACPPQNWRRVKLGDLIDEGFCVIKNNLRKPLSSATRSEMQGKYPYYGAAGQIDSINDYKLEGFHLLIAEDGTVTSDGIRPMLQLVSGKFWVSNHAHILQGKTKKDTRLLYYMLNTVNINAYITGAVQPKLSKENLLRIKLNFPPTEQKAIAEVLSGLDDKIDLLHRQNKTLEDIAESIFKKMFRQPSLSPSQREGNDEADEGWEEKRLGEVVNIKYGKNLPTSKLTESGFSVFGGNGQIGFYSEYHYEKPQVLISCRGEASGKVNISAPKSFITNNSLVLEIPENSYLTFEFLKYFALSTNFRNYVSGSAQPQITIEGLTPAKVRIPDKDLIKGFTNFSSDIEEKLLKNQSQIRTLENMRDTLLPKLMSGEVRVKDFTK